ncbi:hypothetical protein E4T38_03566 [Aureobasidium subglaciale]|nr:hypothetical protein E4T38_03566 [Aureobasidium subglaciale]KAI5225647.1 hypothetical protein E4T40_03341 [Aureobasidium subglaciale]KAI5229184.1 hypothetical protein E4T41_03594 [Aureobasidium subglaciale]KAI5263908.1 hypothetical protein E4T46_03340 [Aureobasidium subglaciale]
MEQLWGCKSRRRAGEAKKAADDDSSINCGRHQLFTITPAQRATILTTMSYFRITLLRSSIGLPKQASGVLKALGLRKRMKTVYHPVSQQVAGQIFAVKELVDVQEVDQKFTPEELKELRRPDSGFYVESRHQDQRMD